MAAQVVMNKRQTLAMIELLEDLRYNITDNILIQKINNKLKYLHSELNKE